MNNGQQPAFPITNSEGFPTRTASLKEDFTTASGLTKREYFAAMAMQGFAANRTVITSLDPASSVTTLHELLATESIKMADELLKQLEQ